MDTNVRLASDENDRQEPHSSDDHPLRPDARRPLPVLPVEYGSGWYHDTAIKDHERAVRQG